MEPVCVTLRRHLHKDHPLAQILKFHCRGILTAKLLGVPKLVLPGQILYQLSGFAHTSAAHLVNTGYMGTGWKETDFKNNIKVTCFCVNFSNCVFYRITPMCLNKNENEKNDNNNNKY